MRAGGSAGIDAADGVEVVTRPMPSFSKEDGFVDLYSWSRKGYKKIIHLLQNQIVVNKITRLISPGHGD
jgi:hypothetical protein